MTSRLATLLALSLALSAHADRLPKNVILIIGDGMGPAHYTACQNLRGEKFRIGTMRIMGMVTTHAADRAVTDSAAAASALATGEKTHYQAISVDANGAPRGTVGERAEQSGKATGVVTTAPFWDATPAAFAAHAMHRYDDAAKILPQMLRSGLDVIAGSGAELLGKNGLPSLVELLQGTGFQAITAGAELEKAEGAQLLALFNSQTRDADWPEAPLPVLTRWAIERLRHDPEGFFLLVEHEGTDTASHANSTPEVSAALQSFDEAVGVALDFARANKETLVIVTSDHETGALRLTQTSKLAWRMEWGTVEHTGVAVPLFAFGPSARGFEGLQDNTDVGKKLLSLVTVR